MENAPDLNENFCPTNANDLKPIRLKFDGELGLRDLLIYELKSMYYIERLLTKEFPKLIKNACSFEFIEALTIHQEDTKKQIKRLEDSFEKLGENPILNRNKSLEYLLQEIDTIIDITKFGLIRDAGMILVLHKIEHFEIASYTILATFAENIKEQTIATWMHESLNEEKIAQMRMAKIAQSIQFYSGDTTP